MYPRHIPRHDYGKVIELNQNCEPIDFAYKTNRQKCKHLLQKGAFCLCFLGTYVTICALGYQYGRYRSECDGSQ